MALGVAGKQLAVITSTVLVITSGIVLANGARAAARKAELTFWCGADAEADLQEGREQTCWLSIRLAAVTARHSVGGVANYFENYLFFEIELNFTTRLFSIFPSSFDLRFAHL